jgi:type I restriction enzyme S subunit
MKKYMNIPNLRFPDFKGEWEMKKFDEIFLFSTGKSIKQNEASPKFEIPCVRYGELYHMYNEVITKVVNKTNLDKSELLFSGGDEILLPSAGEDPLDIGSASALTIKNVAIGRTINILKPAKENVYSQIFASYCINHRLKETISKLAKGVSISNVYNSDLKTLEITLPNLAEQTKIATFLTAVDEKLQALKKKKSLLEAYKKGVMQKIFSQELRFKDENGEDFADWEVRKLGEVGETYGGLSGKSKEDFGIGKPYIQYKQIFDDSKIDTSRFELVDIRENESQNKVQFGDVFFTVSSETPNEIGMSSVLLDDIEELYLNSFCFGYRANSLQVLSPYFSQYLFRSETFRAEIIKLAQGSTRYNMSKIQLLKNKIPIPCLAEQTVIANFLSSIDEKIAQAQAQIKKTETWKKGLLQKMFV